jgi:hypothetical protein
VGLIHRSSAQPAKNGPTQLGLSARGRSRGLQSPFHHAVAHPVGKEMGRWPMGWPDTNIFQNSNFVQTSKFKFSTMPTSKNVKIFHGDRFEHDEQRYPLVQLPIPNGSHVINFGSNSNLNFP